MRVKLSLLVVALGSLAFASPASAEVSHVFGGAFGAASTTPANPYPVTEPTDVEIDQATHDVYVADPVNHRIEKFDSAGNFLLMFGKAVDQTTGGNVCTAASGNTCQAGTSGQSPAAFESPTYLAVDNMPGGNGDVYVGDSAAHLVQKFNSSGQLITGWGAGGQKDGSDATDSPNFGPINGLAVGGGCATTEDRQTGTCMPNGTLYVLAEGPFKKVLEYMRNGEYLKWTVIGDDFFFPTPWIKADAEGNYFYDEEGEEWWEPPVLWEGVPLIHRYSEGDLFQFGTVKTVEGFNLDPATHEMYQDTGTRIAHFSGDCRPVADPCDPLDFFGFGELQEGGGVAVDGASHRVYVVDTGANQVLFFEDARPIVTTGPPTGITTSSVTLTGEVDPAGRGDVTECFFEYGFDQGYGFKVPCVPDASSTNYTTATAVTATLTGLSPGTREHYRLVARNTADGGARGRDETFATTAPPAINGLVAENLTATSADLIAKVNPNGLATSYAFEYGPSTDYGQKVTGTIDASTVDETIEAHLVGLQPHIEYHYRLVADNSVQGKEEGGVTASEDHTFDFYPPACPNENVRQQVAANYLPDCRAYELVSPSDANGTQLYPGGPNTGYATSPSRFAYTGTMGTIQEAGGAPLGGEGDLYVATRTDTGWRTKYVGFAANEAAVDGGPPQGLWGQGGDITDNRTSRSYGNSGIDVIQNNVLADPGMNRILDWNDGPQEALGPNPTPIASNAAHVWRSDGQGEGVWPTNLATVPPGQNPALVGGVSPGGMNALDCPIIHETGHWKDSRVENNCPGEVTASADLSNFVFSSEWNVFAPGGQLSAPGSVYDNNTETDEVTVVSKTPAGSDIPREPTNLTEFPLEMPSVSSDGSHILIAAPALGPCGLESCPNPPCGDTVGTKVHCPPQPSHLYMRVNDAVTFDVSSGHAVEFVGGTADLHKVYFTSGEQLTADDNDASIDLFMWSEAGAEHGEPLTLASPGADAGVPGEPGDADSCKASFVPNCGVVTYSNNAWCQLYGGAGGNCRSDSSVASLSGDAYFFSPELLDGSRGIPNKENLYVFRGGHTHYVATLTSGRFCKTYETFGLSACSDTPATRMQVTPDGSYMAFLTTSSATQYESAGHQEMYRYNAVSGKLICVSCKPDGEPPETEVGASQNGLFMSNDGRAFFSTEDPLVHGDTNKALDVYEYAGGRPQLITTGTGETRIPGGFFSGLQNPPGLHSVSADGRDVYFATYETLVRQDHNGLFLKYYDARAGGGFSAPAPPPPCEAADECHGEGSSPPPVPEGETGVSLSGGNVGKARHAGKRHRHRHRHRARHHRGARHGRGGSR